MCCLSDVLLVHTGENLHLATRHCSALLELGRDLDPLENYHAFLRSHRGTGRRGCCGCRPSQLKVQ